MIRPATPADAAAVAEVYAHHVRHGTASFEEVPPDAEEIARRMAAILDRGWPWLVAAGADGAVLGYAYAGQLNPRSGYRYSCEDSVYVRHDAIGRGIGSRLLPALIDSCRAAGFRRMFAVIGDAGNAGSIALHARHGFTHAGTLQQAGYKFGRWLDVVHMERPLEEP